MSSREQILNALRSSPPAFDHGTVKPDRYLSVTSVPDADPVARFTTIAESLTSQVYRASSPQDVIQTVLNILGTELSVLAWSDLPVAGLADALLAKNMSVIVPDMRTADRTALQRFAAVRVGITGVDAAFATTGTLVVASTPQQGRIPSLLPPVHIALLPRNRLYPTMEAWLHDKGDEALQTSRSVTFISGPSRTADIEMQPILGVHGPGKIHIILF